jgi:hypothetical protein
MIEQYRYDLPAGGRSHQGRRDSRLYPDHSKRVRANIAGSAARLAWKPWTGQLHCVPLAVLKAGELLG